MYCFWMLCCKSWMPSIEVFPVTTSMWKWNRNLLEQERISSNSFCHSPWEHLMIRIVTPFDSLCPSCGFYSRINRVWWDTSNYSLQWFKMLSVCISGSFIERSWIVETWNSNWKYVLLHPITYSWLSRHKDQLWLLSWTNYFQWSISWPQVLQMR